MWGPVAVHTRLAVIAQDGPTAALHTGFPTGRQTGRQESKGKGCGWHLTARGKYSSPLCPLSVPATSL